jgi:hypothetical protein
MVIGYNGGIKSQRESFYNYIREKYIERGVSDIPIDVKRISDYLTKEIQVCITESLAGVSQYKYGLKNYISAVLNTADNISIKLKYLSYVYTVYKYEIKRHRVHLEDNKGKKKMVKVSHFQNTGEVDEDQVLISFSPLFIQSLDAHIVYTFMNHLKDIEEASSIKLSFSTNHDAFGMSLQNIFLLSFLVQMSYNSLNDLILPFIEKKGNIQCQNPNCIKY